MAKYKNKHKHKQASNYAPSNHNTNLGGVAKYEGAKVIEATPMLREQSAIKFELDIPDMIYEQIMTWVDASQQEVSWFGTLTRNGNVFRVEKVMLLEQEVTGADTEINDESLALLMHDVIKNNTPGDLNWWGHSHVDFSVFWSAQDMHTILDIGRRGWVLASVFNQKREIKTAFLQSTEVLGRQHDMFIDDIPTRIITEVSEDLRNEWLAEYKAKVKVSKAYANYPATPNNLTPSTGYPEPYDDIYDDWEAPGNLMPAPSVPNYDKITAVDVVCKFWDSDGFNEALTWFGIEDLEIFDKGVGENSTSFTNTWNLDSTDDVNKFANALGKDLGWDNPSSEEEPKAEGVVQ